jgi:hypothetical protein
VPVKAPTYSRRSSQKRRSRRVSSRNVMVLKKLGEVSEVAIAMM